MRVRVVLEGGLGLNFLLRDQSMSVFGHFIHS